MDLVNSLFSVSSAIEAVVVISMICAAGLALGKVRFFGISLGVAFVFFFGIMFGSFGITIDHNMLICLEDFGLALFVYTLGLHVGPNFFASFRQGNQMLVLRSAPLVSFS